LTVAEPLRAAALAGDDAGEVTGAVDGGALVVVVTGGAVVAVGAGEFPPQAVRARASSRGAVRSGGIMAHT
jgi:hypothetical protein